MTTVYFVRHAQPNYNNHDDSARELTEKGMKDSEKVADFFEEIEVDVMLSSPFKRSVDTIKKAAERKGLSIGLIDDFRERKMTNEWVEDLGDFFIRQWEDFSYKLTGGESLGEVQTRNIRALNGVLQDYPNQTIVIGSHGTALSTIVNYFHKQFGYEQFEHIKGIMPWIVKFTFEGKECTQIKSIEDLNLPIFEKTLF